MPQVLPEPEFDELYRELILDHYRNPRHHEPIADADVVAEGYNPLCGDRVKVMVHVEDGVITDLSFQGIGCAISKASASLMTETLKGKALEEASRIFDGFREALTEGREAGAELPAKLNALRGVTRYPMRVKCATLAWHALRSALDEEKN